MTLLVPARARPVTIVTVPVYGHGSKFDRACVRARVYVQTCVCARACAQTLQYTMESLDIEVTIKSQGRKSGQQTKSPLILLKGEKLSLMGRQSGHPSLTYAAASRKGDHKVKSLLLKNRAKREVSPHC